MSNEILGHRPNGDGVQIHSAGDIYPAVVYAMEFYPQGYEAGAVKATETGTLFHAVLVYGFDWGVFRSHEDATSAAKQIMAVKELTEVGRVGEAFTKALALAKFINLKRAARAGLTPYPWEERDADNESLPRDMGDAIERAQFPIQIRSNWGSSADGWLRQWGFDPQIF